MKNRKLLLSLSFLLHSIGVQPTTYTAQMETNTVDDILNNIENELNRASSHRQKQYCETEAIYHNSESQKPEIQNNPQLVEFHKNLARLFTDIENEDLTNPETREQIHEVYGPLLNKTSKLKIQTDQGPKVRIVTETDKPYNKVMKAESTANQITNYIEQHPVKSTLFTAVIIGGIVYIYQTYYQDQDYDIRHRDQHF